MRAHQTLNSTSANYGPTNPDNPLIIHKPELSYHDWLVNTLENDRDPQNLEHFSLDANTTHQTDKSVSLHIDVIEDKIRCNNKAIFFFLLWPTFPHTTHWLFKLSHMRKEIKIKKKKKEIQKKELFCYYTIRSRPLEFENKVGEGGGGGVGLLI